MAENTKNVQECEALILKAVRSHDALVKALEFYRNATSEELFDDCGTTARAALASLEPKP